MGDDQAIRLGVIGCGGIFIEHGVHFFDLFECWLGPGRIVAAQQAVRPGTDLQEQVQCTVCYDRDVLVNMYHGFHQPSRMDRQKFQLLFERGEVTLYEWVPTRLGIHAIADEVATRTLCNLFPGARLDITDVYDGRQRRCRGCHQAIDVWQMLDLTVGEGVAKYHLYGELLRAMMRDQVAWIRDSDHQRKVTEHNGRASLVMAIEADRLAHCSAFGV